jgi:hypothetical protein
MVIHGPLMQQGIQCMMGRPCASRHRDVGGAGLRLRILLTSLDGGERLASRPERFNLRKSQLPTGKEAEWIPAPIWTLYTSLGLAGASP